MCGLQPTQSASDSTFSASSSPTSSLPSTASPPASVADTFPMLAAAAQSFQKNVSFAHLAEHAAHASASFDQALTEPSPISMLPNYEISPSGDETGDFLVVDLGGSTLRVAVISIAEAHPDESRESRAGRISVVTSRSWTVENSFKAVNRGFFAWIADKIHETLAAQTVLSPSAVITTGITWSFPLQSTSYNTADIFHMGKGYTVDEEIVGSDLKALLESTVLASHGIRLDVQSIINDSLAVFSAARFLDSRTSLAMVLGTGLNFCCQLNASEKIASSKLLHDEKHVLFNTETSLFGHELVPAYATKYDCIIDERFADCSHFLPHMSVDPKTNTIFQPFELLSSGRYLPELARLVLVDIIAKKEIFTGQKNFEALANSYQGFTGELMCYICESTDDFAVAERLENSFNWAPQSVTLTDVANIKLVFNSIVRRAAYIVAVAIVAYVKLLARHNGAFPTDSISIGYVGSIMEYWTTLRCLVLEFVNGCSDVTDLGVRVELQAINESSIVGTAIAAASQLTRSQ